MFAWISENVVQKCENGIGAQVVRWFALNNKLEALEATTSCSEWTPKILIY